MVFPHKKGTNKIVAISIKIEKGENCDNIKMNEGGLKMKFGVIADVHGNAAALKAVLSQIDKTKDIKHIYCVGDMIGIGPDTNEVLEILFARNDVSMITGNHDEAVLALLKGEAHPLSHSHAKEHHQWIAENINKSFIPRLENLPRYINKRIEGKSIHFIHYHIEEKRLNAHISQDPFSRIMEPSLENMMRLFSERNDDLICFGHHHPRHFFKGKDTIYLNPGSLGCQPKPIAPYAVVEIEQGHLKVEIKETDYDNIDFLKSYERLKVPARDFLLKVFHGNQLEGN